MISLGKAGDHLAGGVGRESDGTQQVVQKTIVGHLVTAIHQVTPALHFQVSNVRFAGPGQVAVATGRVRGGSSAAQVARRVDCHPLGRPSRSGLFVNIAATTGARSWA